MRGGSGPLTTTVEIGVSILPIIGLAGFLSGLLEMDHMQGGENADAKVFAFLLSHLAYLFAAVVLLST